MTKFMSTNYWKLFLSIVYFIDGKKILGVGVLYIKKVLSKTDIELVVI